MTTEEKAKAYDKVREKIALRFGSNVAEEIFSEYEESGNERIRKAILELVRQSSEVLDKQNQNNMIEWLEKQGEQKPQRIISAEAKEAMYDKPAWSKEDDEHVVTIIEYLNTLYDNNRIDLEEFNDTQQWLESLKQRLNN